MSNSDQDRTHFDEEWRGAFEGSERKPSSRVWAGIDAHWEAKRQQRNRRRLVYVGMAASWLLCLTWGLVRWYGGYAPSPATATGQLSAPGDQPADLRPLTAAKAGPTQTPDPVPPSAGGTLSTRERTTSSEQLWSKSEQPTSALGKVPNQGSQNLPSVSPLVSEPQPRITAPPHATLPTQTHQPVASAPRKVANPWKAENTPPFTAPLAAAKRGVGSETGGQHPTARLEKGARLAKRPPLAAPVSSETPSTFTHPAALEGLATRGWQTTGVQRVPAAEDRLKYQPPLPLTEPLPAETQKTPEKSPFWISSTFTPSYYNPDLQAVYQSATAASTQYAYSNLNARATQSPQKQPQEDNTRPELSYALGVTAGADLSKRWMLECGVQYLYNRAGLQTSAYVQSSAVNEKYPIVADLLGSTQSSDRALNDAVTNDAISPAVKEHPSAIALNSTGSPIELRYQYQHISLPLKLGYQLNRQEKWRWIASAGLATDLFLRNQLSGVDANVPTTVITPDNNTAYKSINFSGLLGMGMHYHYASRFSLLVEPTYRASLFSTTKSSINVRTRPSNLGVSVGMKYHF